MKKLTKTGLLAIALWTLSSLFIACNPASDDSTDNTDPTKQDSLDIKDSVSTLDSNLQFAVILERLYCNNYCPEYSIRLDQKGELIYNGKTNVATKGIVLETISDSLLLELHAKLNALDIDQYDEAYTKSSESCETIDFFSNDSKITFVIEGESKTINHYHGCKGFPGESELTEFEDWIDEAFDTQQWIEAN